MVLIRKICFWGFFLTLLFTFPNSSGAEPAEIVNAGQPVSASFPGLSELGPRASALTAFVEKSEGQLNQLATVKEFETSLTQNLETLSDLRRTIEPLGDPKDWYVDRLNQYNRHFSKLKDSVDVIQKKLSLRQQNVELINSRIQLESDFWQSWGASLKKQDVVVPEKTIANILLLLTRLQNSAQTATSNILTVQEKVSLLQQELTAELEVFSEALSDLRETTLRKNAYSFFAPDFYAQFDSKLLSEALQGWQNAVVLDREYLQQYSWAFGLILLGIFIIFSTIKRYAPQLKEYENWQFVLSHPLAAGGFISFVQAANLLPAPPEQVRFLILSAAILFGVILAAELVENQRQARMLYLSALVLVLTSGFRFISLPQPFFRMYISLLALAVLPVLSSQIRLSLHIQGADKGRTFRLLLRLSIGIMLVSLVSQFFGYMNFSSWLLQATFETGMVLLFATMTLRIGQGLIAFMMHQPLMTRNKFFKHYGQQISQRLLFMLQSLIAIYSLIYLLPVWRFFASSRDVLNKISEISLTVGDIRISLEMVLLALLTMFFTTQISWLLQALFESRLTYQKAVDRGVRDAIKKLVHYGVMTIGFLTALSALGMGLQNFVVILGALGVGIGFGLQDIVNNFLSGLILLFERPVKVGDFIVVNEEWGTISKIGLRSTVVETINHSEIIVPNSQLISEKVTNWTFSSRIARLVIPVGVAYGSNVELVMRILTEVATGHPDAVHEPAPSILFIEFGDSSLNFEIRVFVQDISARLRIRSEMLQQIDAHFREAGVEIPFPQRDLHLRSVDGQILEKMEPQRTEP